MKRWQCSVCKYIHEGDEPPAKCPICGVPASKFVLLEEGAEVKPPASAIRPKPGAKAPAGPKAQSVPKPPPKPAPKPETVPKTGYEKFTHFMVKHHAHPVSVHMPNGILPVSVTLFILAWLFGSSLFVKAGFINLVFVILSLPLVLFTGVLEWKKKYNQGLTTIFKVKILAATLTTSACLVSVVWYLIDPEVMASSRAWIFILVNLVMLASAGIAGHIGGKLVFKD